MSWFKVDDGGYLEAMKSMNSLKVDGGSDIQGQLVSRDMRRNRKYIIPCRKIYMASLGMQPPIGPLACPQRHEHARIVHPHARLVRIVPRI